MLKSAPAKIMRLAQKKMFFIDIPPKNLGCVIGISLALLYLPHIFIGINHQSFIYGNITVSGIKRCESAQTLKI